ncbi:hypothetical protein [Streptacidiphilus melanogenes]|uniref:hypothetical protein n=1 Tax=Streptacidiphilus melanogenes TaxID=411235 RepID=UPI0005AB8238|nr:hypothetical protein [Streptacidiphilus melanogenes]
MSDEAIAPLKEDPKAVRKLFRESHVKGANQGAVVSRILEELTVHTYVPGRMPRCPGRRFPGRGRARGVE